MENTDRQPMLLYERKQMLVILLFSFMFQKNINKMFHNRSRYLYMYINWLFDK